MHVAAEPLALIRITTMLVARTRQQLTEATTAIRTRHDRLALVPTMGALHAGHLSLVAHAQACGGVVVSIFVNPLQFNQSDDLARYPRDEAGDLARLSQAGCDAVWLPDRHAMYPAGDATLITVGGPAEGWEGAERPGHFRGVATVVAKLFGQIRPDAAYFGEKDWQQLQVIRRMQADLALGVRIVGVATQREADGVALSSRNRFLTATERVVAPDLYATLQSVRADLLAGVDAPPALAHAQDRLRTKGFRVDYLALVHGETMLPADKALPDTRLIAAARLGGIRLLDNLAI